MRIQNPNARTHISLNGLWNIIVDPYENGFYNHRYEPHENGYFKNQKPRDGSELIEYDFDTSPKLNVPGDWNSQDEKLFLYEGVVWYHREFDVLKGNNKRYVIHFGAVNYLATVFVNGERVGSHEGGFTPFQFDVTELIKSGRNFVVVMVDNRREPDRIPTVNTDWWNYGGITRPVKLIELPAAYIEDYKIHYDPDGKIRGWVNVHGREIENQLAATVHFPELGRSADIKIDESGFGSFVIPAKPALWSPSAPKLYDVILTYGDSEVTDRIGFRTIKFHGSDIFLNGESIFLRGICIHEEVPFGDGRAWHEEDARTLLKWAKDLGCNFVRLAHYPHNETMVRAADEMGLLVWSEIPVYWTILFDREDVYQNAEQQLREMIGRDQNRASVILWSVANETPNRADRLHFLKRLVEVARSIDGSRLITAAMDTQATTEFGKLIDDPFAEAVDVIGINSYAGWYIHTPEEVSQIRWESKTDKPIIMSEWGAGALQGKYGDKQERFTEEHQAFVYRENIEMLKNIENLRGVTPWILKDFRSPRRHLPAIQDFWNRKGLISDRGIKKKAWFVVENWYRSMISDDKDG